MGTYLVRRLLLLIPTLLLVTIIVFLLVRFIPGSAVDLMVAEMSDLASHYGGEDTVEAVRESLGLDVAIPTQYGRWLGVVPQENGAFSGVFQGDLGNSLWTARPVLDSILARFPITLEIGLIALIAGLLIALPIGVFSAIRQDTTTDYMGRTVAIIFISVPSFWLGTMLIIYPAVWWNWAPSTQYVSFLKDPIENLRMFIPAGILLGMILSGTTMRMARSMMLEVMRQDYIRTAWAKGLKERVVVMRHALKNALIPVVTTVGVLIPVLIGGSVVIEKIFTLPGVGLFLVEALNYRDYPIISGINLFTATVIVIVNLAIDMTYAWLDPRVKYK